MNTKKALSNLKQKQNENLEKIPSSSSGNIFKDFEVLKRSRESVFDDELEQFLKKRKTEFSIIDHQRNCEINRLMQENKNLKEKNDTYESDVRKLGKLLEIIPN